MKDAVKVLTTGLLLAALVTFGSSWAVAAGTWLSAAGPVNRSMGGASTAAPLDPIGAMYWNPATISGLEDSQLGFGLDLLYSNHSVSSQAGPFQGTTKAENGFFPIPTVGWVHHVEESPFTLGLFVGGVAGFKTAINADPTNPIVAAPPVGLGRISSEATFLQLNPAVSYAVNESLSIGAGPTVTMAELEAEPMIFDSPNTNGVYPSGRASRYHWGGGAQAGVYYIAGDTHWGLSVKSPTWMETFRFFSQDATGSQRVLNARINLPLIISLGTAYSGLENWLFAMDIRYFDYRNTTGLGSPASFAPAGNVSGLGWDSVMALALGCQRKLGDTLFLRGGYTFNQNPIKGDDTMFNLASPLFYQHMLSTGLSWQMNPGVSVNLAYSYVLPSEISGPLFAPGVGAVPGTQVSQRLDAHVVDFGVVTRY